MSAEEGGDPGWGTFTCETLNACGNRKGSVSGRGGVTTEVKSCKWLVLLYCSRHRFQRYRRQQQNGHVQVYLSTLGTFSGTALDGIQIALDTATRLADMAKYLQVATNPADIPETVHIHSLYRISVIRETGEQQLRAEDCTTRVATSNSLARAHRDLYVRAEDRG